MTHHRGATATAAGISSKSIAMFPLVLLASLVLPPRVGSSSIEGHDSNPPQSKPELDGPLTPDRAANTFRIEPGLRLELVAAEPLVVSPVALAFDERGRMFVAENEGYPTGPGEGKPPAGRIVMLEDTDDDGRMDRRTVFADGLTFPNGVMPWNGGLVVTCAPDVFHFKDTDGDGRADVRKILFTGFATSASTQLRVSHPTLSIDNWIYLTSGLSGGNVVSPDAPERPAVELKRTDFRFRPNGHQWEAADGGSQFGLTFDDFGRRFICYNRVQVQHVVLSSKMLRRNPHLAFSETVQNCPAEMLPEPARGHGMAARLFPISQNVTTADSHAGTFTAACGVTVYRGAGLPDSYRGAVFSCDHTGNLVHFDQLDPRGASFVAKRVRDGVEFLASTDNWFRPVFLAHGPDGALYICDMYRKTIEHPDYLPVEIRKHTDFDSGKTMGRVWRVISDDLKPAELARRRRVDLAVADTAELCDQLRSSDGWFRDTAHRLLLERDEKSAVPVLERMVRNPEESPATVVHALRLLDAMESLGDELVEQALRHPAAPVREHALELAEPKLGNSSPWTPLVLTLSEDADARVRFRAALALGLVANGGVPETLARIAARDREDRWLRAAVFSSLAGRELEFLDALRKLQIRDALPVVDLFRELGRLIGAGLAPKEWPNIAARILLPSNKQPFLEQAALVSGLADSLRGRGVARDQENWIRSNLGTDHDAAAQSLDDLYAEAMMFAGEERHPIQSRVTAIGLLAHTDFATAGDMLLELAEPSHPQEVQLAAVRALGLMHGPHISRALLNAARFVTYTPAVREEVIGTLLTHTDHLPGLLEGLEQGTVPTIAIDSVRRRQLQEHRDSAVRNRADRLFGRISDDRAKVYEEHKEVADWQGDPSNGRAVFKRECASCHRLDRDGFPVGPDLFGIRNQPKQSILLHILVPDHEITLGFTAYTVAMRDGRVLNGLIASETPTSVTIRQQMGKEDTILRSDIEEIVASNLSLMPQGVEQKITKQEFADLLAYLKGESP